MLAWLTSPTKVCPCMLQKGQAEALPAAAKDTLASRAARQIEKRRSGEPTIGRTPKCLVQRILEAVGQSRLSRGTPVLWSVTGRKSKAEMNFRTDGGCSYRDSNSRSRSETICQGRWASFGRFCFKASR